MTLSLDHYLPHLSQIIILCVILITGIGIGFYYAAKLKSNEALWKLALEGTGDGVWDWDMVRDVARFSDSYKSMFGFDDAEIKLNLQAWKERIYPDDVMSMNKVINDYLAGKTEKYIHEHRIICKDKNVKWVLSRGMTVKHDKNGKPLRMVGTHTDITERKLLETRLENLAHFDTLTGLPNRTLFSDRLKLAVAYAKREKKMLAVMFVDLDQFKEINDLYGHKIGDKVLKKVAQRLTACVRESDTVCRIGGDEFIVLLPIIDSEIDATYVADKIVSAVARPIEIVKSSEISQPIKVIQKNLHVSASIGISIYPTHGKDEKLLTINADLAMYQAKRNGKNQAVLFDAEAMQHQQGFQHTN